MQTLRTRIFLSLSDDASADIASKLCGQVAKIKPSWTVTESAQQAQVSLLSGRAGGSKGSVGTSKSFREQREALFQPREFGLLPNGARASLDPRFNLHHGGTWTPPNGGVAPVTVIPAGRLEVWRCKGL